MLRRLLLQELDLQRQINNWYLAARSSCLVAYFKDIHRVVPLVPVST